MKYIYIKQKKRLNSYKKNEFFWFIYKWIKKNNNFSKKYQNIILHNLKKNKKFKSFSTTQFHKICYQTWRSKTTITPFGMSKTLIKVYSSKGFIGGLKRL